MKSLFFNGNIYTMDDNFSKYSAMLVEDNKIVKLGSDDELSPALDEDVKKVDLEGKTVLPGFIDTHLHMIYDTIAKKSVDLTNCCSVDEVISTGEDFFKECPPFRGWVTGRGWDQGKFEDQKFITREDLDKISTEVPIIFERVCGHTVAVNTPGLEKILNLEEATDFERFIEAEHGLLRESATMLRNKTMDDLTVAEIKDIILEGQEELNAAGITGVHSSDFLGGIDENQWKDIIQAYKELDQEGKLTARVYEQSMFMRDDNIEEYLNSEYNTGDGSSFFKIGPLKLLHDGSLGGRTAAMIEPYDDDKNEVGYTIRPYEELLDICDKAYSKDMQVTIHGIGDKAALDIVSIFKELNEKYGKKDRRNGLVHAQFLNEEILQTLKDEEIVCHIQPIFIDDDMRLAKQRVGEERMKYAYIWKTLIDRGIHVGGGSDAPVCSFNVIENLHAAVNRENLNREPAGGWYPEEKISVEDAVRLFTNWAAYFSFEEDVKGSLEPGKFADFVVLSKNIFEIDPENILDTKVLSTYIDGKEIYSA